MIRGVALGASLLAVLAEPATWVLGLLTFLLRGGWIVVLAPIVTIPSAVGLGNLLGPALTHLALGDLVTGAIVVGLTGLLVVVLWLGVAGLVAAAAEAEAIRRIAADDETGLDAVPSSADARSPGSWGVAGRILLARVVALLPLVVALAVGGIRVVAVTYRELTLPSATATPLIVRVLASAADALALILVAWVIAEVVGGLAARRIVLARAGVLAGLAGAVQDIVRHPFRILVGAVVPALVLLVVLVTTATATDAAWVALRATLTGEPGVPLTAALVSLLVALWLGGLVLIGLVSAWRGAVWTVQVARTFGGVETTRPGDWRSVPTSGIVADLRSPGAEPDSR